MKKGVKKKEINVESVLRKNLTGLSLKEIVKETGFSEEEVKRRLKNLKSKNKIKVKGILNKKYFYLELDKKEEINKKLEKREEKNVGSLDNKKELLNSDALLNMLEDLEKEKENSRKKEELFRSLVETSPDCIKLLDLNGNLKFINKGGLDEHGLKSSSDAVKSGWKAIDTIVKEDKGKFIKAVKDAKKGKITTFEIRHTSEGSNREICLETIAPVKNFRGKVRGIFGVSRDLTTLKRSEEKYKALYLSSKDAIMTLSPPDWNFSSGNPSAIKLFGVKDEKEFISRSPGEYSPKKQPDGALSSVKAKEMIEKAMREGSNFFEWVHKRINGEEFLATVLLTRVQIGKKKFLQATVRDISFKKKIESKLKESEERYRKLFENSISAIYIFDNSKKFINSNLAGLKLLGYSKKELFKLKMSDVDENPKKVLRIHKKLFSGEVIEGYEHELKRKDGKIITVLNNSQPIKDKRGKIVGVQSTLIDITDKKNIQRRYKEIVENINDIIYEIDIQGKITYISPNVFKFSGYSSDFYVGKNIRELIHSEDVFLVLGAMKKTFKDGKEVLIEFRVKIKSGGYLWVEEYGKLIRDSKGNFIGMRGILRDITLRKEKQNKLESVEKVLNAGRWIWNIKKNKVFWSENLYSLFGMKKSGKDLTFEDYLKFVPRDFRQKVKKEILDSLKIGSFSQNVKLVINGEERIHHVEGKTYYDLSNNPVRIEGISQDITSFLKPVFSKEREDDLEMKNEINSKKVIPRVKIKREDILNKIKKSSEKEPVLNKDFLNREKFSKKKVRAKEYYGERYYLKDSGEKKD